MPGDRRLRRALILTFDDGPDPRFTPQVLDVLGEAGVQARFYCVGRRALAWPELVRRIDGRGPRGRVAHDDPPRPVEARSARRDGATSGPASGPSSRRSARPVPRFRAPFGRLGDLGAHRARRPAASSTTTGTSTRRTGRPTPTRRRCSRSSAISGPTPWCCCTTARSRRPIRPASTARRRSRHCGCSSGSSPQQPTPAQLPSPPPPPRPPPLAAEVGVATAARRRVVGIGRLPDLRSERAARADVVVGL